MDAAGYYIQASETGGEPPGRWWGPGAKALGLEPGKVVEREPYDLLFGEHKRQTAPRSAGHQAAVRKPRTSTLACWPPNHTLPPSANANCGLRRSARPGKARCTST
jgi:hypothetical protein